MNKKNKILITGATGFIGSNITRYLIEHYKIKPYIIVRKTSNMWRIKNILEMVNIYYVELIDSKNLKKVIFEVKPNIIVHTAVYGGYYFQKDKEMIFKTNFWATFNLLNICNEIDYELFINTGSSSEYGIKNKPMRESDLLEPISDYGVSKAAATLYCQSLAKREKKPIVTLRLFSPYGYYEDKERLIPSVIISCINQKDPMCSSPNSVRDFIFIEDVVESYIKVIENKEKCIGEVLNIGFGQQHTVKEVVDEIIKNTYPVLKPKWDVINNPRTEPKIWQADISKLEKILGWQPRYSLEEGLKKTIKWFKENLYLYSI